MAIPYVRVYQIHLESAAIPMSLCWPLALRASEASTLALALFASVLLGWTELVASKKDVRANRPDVRGRMFLGGRAIVLQLRVARA